MAYKAKGFKVQFPVRSYISKISHGEMPDLGHEPRAQPSEISLAGMSIRDSLHSDRTDDDDQDQSSIQRLNLEDCRYQEDGDRCESLVPIPISARGPWEQAEAHLQHLNERHAQSGEKKINTALV